MRETCIYCNIQLQLLNNLTALMPLYLGTGGKLNYTNLSSGLPY